MWNQLWRSYFIEKILINKRETKRLHVIITHCHISNLVPIWFTLLATFRFSLEGSSLIWTVEQWDPSLNFWYAAEISLNPCCQRLWLSTSPFPTYKEITIKIKENWKKKKKTKPTKTWYWTRQRGWTRGRNPFPHWISQRLIYIF